MGASTSIARVALAFVALGCWAPRVFAADPKLTTVVVGAGHSEIVEYDRDLKALRRWVGFEQPVDVTGTADGTLLIVDQGWRKVLELERGGAVRWSAVIGEYPQRARQRADGGLLVASADKVLGLAPDHWTEFEIDVPGLRAAMPLANGNVLVAYNQGQGWLAEMTTAGEVVRRTAVAGYVDSSGRWVAESPKRFFNSVSSLDVGPDGTIFTANFDGADVRLLAPDLRPRKSFSPFVHATDTRFGPNGELVVVSPEQGRVWVRWSKGHESSLPTPMEPRCASLTPWGTLVVGLWWHPESQALNATLQRMTEPELRPWWQAGLPLPIAGALIALAVAWRVRRGGSLGDDSSASDSAVDRPPSGDASPGSSRLPAARYAGAFACAAVLAGTLVLSWHGLQMIYVQNYAEGVWRFLAGGAVAGLALRLMNVASATTGTLTTLDPGRWRRLLRRRDRGRTEGLFGASMLALAACMAIQLASPELQAMGIAFWIAAQVWIVAAAMPARKAAAEDLTAPRRLWPVLALLLAATLASRLWQIGYYPDTLHSDHNLYGLSVLRLLRGNWRPFFILDPDTSTYARPWLLPAAAAMQILGIGYGVLRLTAAISSVLMVWGAYLLAAALYNRRVGLIAAFLVAVNHALLLYSRQPYVIESTAPFLLILYCAFTGARRGCRLHWCLAGIAAGWAMMSPRQSTMFPIICGAIFLYVAIVYPRALWRQRGGIGWMAAGAAAAYLPMLPQMLSSTALARRLATTTVFLNPDGSIRWDRALWEDQIVRSFGSIVYFHDSSAWGVGTWQPICLKLEACLFAAGLIYVLTSWRGAATITLLATIGLSIFLGSALLVSPPTFYHYFVGMVAALIVVAVALDRIAAVFDRWRPARLLASAALVAFLAWVGTDHLTISWNAVRRAEQNGQQAFASDAAAVAARLIRQRPEYRYYLVRSMLDQSATSPEFFFAAADSDVSDISNDLRHVLPVPPADGAPGAIFVVLPSRKDGREAIADTYPDAKAREIASAGGTLWTYEVDADALRRLASR